ncbi:3-hydroxyisobutyrate dehydrogenase [bacterium]|nr:3-hydroxyisobutyrate dehydrogenase [bacterium]
MKKIAFLGVGNMGNPMAQNLHKAGFDLTVFDVSTKALEVATAAGLKAAKSASEATNGVDAIVSMLPASRFVEDLYLSEGGLLDVTPKNTLLIDCSTIAPKSAQNVIEKALAKGFEMIDAPVSGGTAGAAAGTLTFMVGGEESTLEKARPLLEKMGKNIFHAGKAGAGQVAKVCNNMLLAIHMIGSCEALELGSQNGMDPKVLSEILMQSSGRNWSLEVYNPWPGVQENVPSSKEYQGGFAVDLMAKDLGLAMEAGLEKNVSTPLGATARNLYRIHSQNGNGRLDFSSVLKMLQESSR